MRLPWTKKTEEKTGGMISCPRCNAPVPSDNPFCEACGARIAPPPSCSLCGTLLEPGSRFCPSCGTMIGSSKEKTPVPVQKEKSPEKKHRNPVPEQPQTTAEPDAEKSLDPLKVVSEEKPETSDEVIPDKQSPKPPLKAVPSASRATTPPSGKRWGLPTGTGRNTIAVFAIIILLIAGASLISTGFLTLPRFSAPSQGAAVTPTSSATTPAVTATTTIPAASETAPANKSLVLGPTQTLPAHLDITLQEERDPRTKMVSVQYMGGKGQNGVREIVARLTRSDGEVLTGSFKPLQFGSGIELQGTEQTDRLEVIVRYYSGEEYTVVDRVFEYKIRTA